MKVLPLRWHGTTRRERMRAVLESSAKDWLCTWSTSELTLECLTVSRTPWNEASIWGEGLSPTGGQVLARCTRQGLTDLGCLLAGVPALQFHPVAENLGRRALQNCLEVVMANAGSPGAVKWGEALPEAGLDDVRHGTEAFLLHVGGVELVLFANDRLCDLLAPPASKTHRSLVPRAVAVRSETVPLEAVLDLGSMNLIDFRQLRPGDVLKTQARLDAPVRLRHETSQPLATGSLVRRDGHRALELEMNHRTGGRQ